MCQLDAGVAEVLLGSRPRLPEAQAPRVRGNPLDAPGLADQSRPIPVGRPFLADPHHAMVRQECLTYLLDALSADKRSQLAQLALLWSTASCVNWMQVWRRCC